MSARLLAVTGLLAIAGPAAADEVHRTSTRFDPARCTMQQVHTPAGKMVHNAPIIRCREASTQVARNGGKARASQAIAAR